jgi:hypothetical protein
MNSLNTIIANAMEKSKLGEASFYDLFSSPTLEEKICYDDTMPPVYDDYNDEYDIFSPPTIEEKLVMITICLLYLMAMVMRIMIAIFVKFAPTTINKND